MVCECSELWGFGHCNVGHLFEQECRDFQQQAQQFRQDWQKLQKLHGRPDPLVQDIDNIGCFRSSRATPFSRRAACVHAVLLTLLKQVQATERFKLTLQRLDALSAAIVPLIQLVKSRFVC
jgi:hypothetical protein